MGGSCGPDGRNRCSGSSSSRSCSSSVWPGLASRTRPATIIGITALLVSPISWIHHGVWIVPEAGVLLGDGRETWRRVCAAGVLAVFVLRLPDWVADGRLAVGPFLTPLLENAYALAYVLLLVFLPVRTPAPDPYPAV